MTTGEISILAALGVMGAALATSVHHLLGVLGDLLRAIRDVRDTLPALRTHRDVEIEYLRARNDRLHEEVLALTRPEVQARLATQEGRIVPPPPQAVRAARNGVRIVAPPREEGR